MSGTIEPPCGVPAHRMGWWEDEVLGIWWCPDCHEEIWTTEGVDDAGSDEAGRSPDVACALRSSGAGLSEVPEAVPDSGDAAGAPADRASGYGVGWRDRDGGARLWHLILEAFGRAAS